MSIIDNIIRLFEQAPWYFPTQEPVVDLTQALVAWEEAGLAPSDRPVTTNTRDKAHIFSCVLGGKPAFICHGRGFIAFGATKEDAWERWDAQRALREDGNIVHIGRA